MLSETTKPKEGSVRFPGILAPAASRISFTRWDVTVLLLIVNRARKSLDPPAVLSEGIAWKRIASSVAESRAICGWRA